MRKLFVIRLFVFCFLLRESVTTNVYVDSVDGNDSNSGSSPDAALRFID